MPTNPLLEDSRAFDVTRRDEVAFNMLRVGSTVFSSGFDANDWRRNNPRRPKCGGPDSAAHFLLHCPATEDLRARMTDEAHEEFLERGEQDRERALRHGKHPPPPKPWAGLQRDAVSVYPAAVLRFITRQDLWLDIVAKGQRCDEAAAGG